MKMKIYVINAKEYGESGKERGVWLNLPMTCNELDATLEKIGVSATDNYIIMDAEVNLPFTYEIGEYTNIAYLNSLAISLAEINCKGELVWLAAYMEATGYSLEFALDNYEDSDFYEGMTLENLEAVLEDDLRIDGYEEVNGGVIYVY